MSRLTNIIQLMRLDKPIGILLLLFPCLFAIGLASKTFPLTEIMLFSLGACLMRAAGCIINDIFDREFDKQVERTKNRPLASGALSLFDALLILAILLIISLLILIQFNKLTIFLGLVIIIPVILYPLMKRITYWPQLFLGLTFNFGAILGTTAIIGEITFSSILLYLGCIFWTLGYDTIYGLQDIEDDLKIGVKSTSILLKENIKEYVAIFYAIAAILIALAAYYADSSYIFYLLFIPGIMQLIWQIYQLQPENKQNCLKTFKSNFVFGGFLLLGFFSRFFT